MQHVMLCAAWKKQKTLKVSLGSCTDERGDTKGVLHTCGLAGTS